MTRLPGKFIRIGTGYDKSHVCCFDGITNIDYVGELF